MKDSPQMLAARLEVERRRGRMIDTSRELQARLSPKKLTQDAWEGAKSKGADIAESAVDAVKARPVATVGVLAAVTMFLARGPLMDLVGSLAGNAKAPKRTRKKSEETKTESVK